MREKQIKKALRITWDSLDSHLDWTHDIPKNKCKYCGSARFHKKTIKEYATIIKILSDLL